jgi:phosphotransferase system IIA component
MGFNRFTEKAIKVIMLAQEEARRLGHNRVGTEQILLGLIGEGTGYAAKTLKSKGINLKDARVQVEKIIGRGRDYVAVEIPLTPQAKQLLEASWLEARHLGDNYIDTQHLLLGLVAHGNHQDHGLAVLEHFGIDPAKLKGEIIKAVAEAKATKHPTLSSREKPRYEPVVTENLTEVLKRTLTELKHQKEAVIRDQQFEVAAWLQEVESKLLEKIRKTEPEWTIVESDHSAQAIKNAVRTIRTAKEAAIREQQFDLAAWLRETETRLNEKFRELGPGDHGQ